MVVLMDRHSMTWSPARPYRHRAPTPRQVSEAVSVLVHGSPTDRIELLFNMLHYHPAMFNDVALEVRRYNLGTQALQQRGH